MLTFLEFYQTVVSFINYRLYTSINLVYPPKLDFQKDDGGAGLSAYLIQSITEQAPAQQEPNITAPVKDTSKHLATLPSKLANLINDSTQTDSQIDSPAIDGDAPDT